MKEYSKAALRRHKQSEKLRERRTARRRGPAVRNQVGVPGGDEDSDTTNPLNLIRREIAIMKKLDHPNIVTLVEVLDDPHGDSIYMILEWCGKGAIMPVSLEDGEAGDSEVGPRYTVDQCRLYFRDMILGIEYLHSQGVIHRDIKADNLLLDEDDVVKIADFGVSEILDPANDTITKNAGSPAYMAPELAAISSHTALKEHAAMKGINVSSLSGKSTDIWSMGVTLYLLVFGKLPFRSDSMVDLFDKIVNQELDIPEGTDSNLVDLLSKILAKAPQDRISMDKLREHPWVTHNNEDMLLSKEENTAINITPVTEEDMYHAIEFVQGLMEPDQAMAKLRRLHGWRGYTNCNTLTTNSRAASLSPTVFPVEPGRSPSPIDETVSLHKLTRALEEVVNKANAYTYLHPNRSMSSIDCSSPSMAGTLSSTTEDSSKILDVSCQEPTMQTSTTLEAVSLSRRPSRTHTRAVMGLESMTSVRS